ncbi:MAG: helix-turn-helix domain-containing protein [Oscillospiraceae bacterium]|nr:helix-turn-helix domain-containing protein [Oscillospiraceae bacterium]
MDAITIGKAIRRLREKKHLTQDVLSGLADIDRGYLGEIENGKYNLTVMVLCKLADALNVKASDILREAEKES